MAIQNRSLIGAEHDWYATRSGLPGNAPLVDHKLAYYASRGFGGNASIRKPLSQIEQEWLAAVGSSTADTPFELWLNACQAQSVIVGKSVNDCKMRFFTSVASGTNP